MPQSPSSFSSFRTPLILIVLSAFVLAGPAGAKKLKEGSPLPEVVWTSTDGDSLSWGDLSQDSPVVVVFWATWCKSCRKQWPRLMEVASRYDDVEPSPAWVSVSLGEPADKVARVARERGYPGAVLCDPKEKIGKALGIDTVPSVIVGSADGKVLYNGAPNIKKIDRLLAKLTTASESEE